MPVRRVERRPWASCREAVKRLMTVVLATTAVASLVAVPPATAQVAEGGFSDVTGGTHKASIDALAEWGLISGTECAPGRFCPGDPMKRWTVAVWLVRALDNVEPPAVSASRFADVDSGAWWAPHVERLAALRVTKGCKTEPAALLPRRDREPRPDGVVLVACLRPRVCCAGRIHRHCRQTSTKPPSMLWPGLGSPLAARPSRCATVPALPLLEPRWRLCSPELLD